MDWLDAAHEREDYQGFEETLRQVAIQELGAIDDFEWPSENSECEKIIAERMKLVMSRVGGGDCGYYEPREDFF